MLKLLCRLGIRFWYFCRYDDNGGNWYCKCGCCKRNDKRSEDTVEYSLDVISKQEKQ